MYTGMRALSEAMRMEVGPPVVAAGRAPAFPALMRACARPLWWLGMGAIVGWPFSGALGIPFVVEFVWLRAVMAGRKPLSPGGASVAALLWEMLRRLLAVALMTVVVLMAIGVCYIYLMCMRLCQRLIHGI